MSEHVWYFLKESFGGESQEGPLTEPQFVQLVKKGHLKKHTKICSPTRTKGQWATVEQVPSINALIDQGKQERAQEKAAKVAAKQESRRPSEPAEAQNIAASVPEPDGLPIPPGAPPTSTTTTSTTTTSTTPTTPSLPAVSPTAHSTPFAAPATNAAKFEETFKPRVYPALSIVRIVCYVMAILVACSLLVSLVQQIIGIFNLEETSGEFYALAVAAIGFSMFAHVMVIVSLVFLANLIKLLIDVQTNTQLTAFNTLRGRFGQ